MSEIVDCIAWIVQKTCYTFYICLKFLLLRLLDLFGLIFNVTACLTVVRFPVMVRQFAEIRNLEEWRYIGLVQLGIFISDIPAMVAGLVVLLTVYRVYPLYKELHDEHCEWDTSLESADIYYSGWQPRKIILKHFALLVIDAFFVPAAFLCICSWRCVIFVREFREATDPWKRRKICFKQFLNIFVDIPCILFYLIILFTWRLPFVIHDLQKTRRNDQEEFTWDKIRYVSLSHAGLLLLDIPCFVFFAAVMVTWRGPFIVCELRKIDLLEDDHEARKVAFIQFLLIFVDIPCIAFFLVVLLTFWRLPFFIQDWRRAFEKGTGIQWRIRKATVVQLSLLLLDIGCLILGLIVLVTLWRIYPMLQAIKNVTKTKKEDAGNNEGYEANGDEEDAVHISHDPGSIVTSDANTTAQELIVDPSESSASQDSAYALNQTERQNEADVGLSINEDHDMEVFRQEVEYSAPNSLLSHKVGWKIRKAICIQFVGLLVDIPAFGCLILLIVTFIRIPKLLSTFLQSSDIHMEFAMTIYFQTFILFVDFFFALLFIILIFLRPIESWIRLLEDEEHKNYRLLRHHMQWIPDIVRERETVYQQIDELMSVNLKMYCLPSTFRASVGDIMHSYLDSLVSLRDKVKENELDPEYKHLLDTVLWWEEKRKEKAFRHYLCEYNYLLRPDARLHKENLEKIKNEMRSFEASTDEQYDLLSQFLPIKVPLWTANTGLSTRSRKETQKVLIKCLPRGDIFLMLLALLCCLPLYRAPQLIKGLCKRWYDRSHIIIDTALELGYDFVTLVKMIFVLAFIYRAPMLLADVSIDIIDKRSWNAVRKTVGKYPLYIYEDMLNILTTILSWKTPRFLFTASLFGILMPADIFLTVSKLCVKRACVAYFLSGALYILFASFPFVMCLYLGRKMLEMGMGWIAAPVTCGFVGGLLMVLAVIVTVYVRNNKETTLIPQPFDYFHWNWLNLQVVIMELLEFFQLLALVFRYPGIPFYGGNVLNKASEFLLLSNFSFEFQFWLVFVLFFIWFFLCSGPVIFEQILEDIPEKTCQNHPGWRTAISLFANTLFITMVEGFASCLACSYVKCPPGIKYTMLQSNDTCLTSYLTDDSHYTCWTGDHKLISLFGMFALVWYTITSFLFVVQFGDPGIKKQDVEFSPTFNVVANFIKSIMTVTVVVMTTDRFAMLIVLLIGNASLIIYTLSFRALFHYKPTNSLSFMSWRVASYFSAMIAATSCIVAIQIDEQGSKIPLMIFGVGTLVALIAAVIVSISLLRKENVVEARDEFKNRIRSLERRMKEEKMLLSSWKKEQTSWNHLIQGVREARAEDQIFNAADWMQLKEKQAEEDVIQESTAALSSAVAPAEEQASVGFDTRDETAKGLTHSADMQLENLPPPPSYDPASVGSVYGSMTPTIPSRLQMFTEDQEKIKVLPFGQPLASLKRNGVNLLLVLERSIRFEAYSYSFFSQRAIWLSSVTASNWVGLLHCLDVLYSNLDFSYDRPSPFDIAVSAKALPTDALEKAPSDDDVPPSFTPESRDPEVIRANSQSQRDQALMDVQGIPGHGERWKELMDKILPILPVIRLWRYDSNSGDFEIILRRPVTATVTEVGPRGMKLAKNAKISLGKVTKGKLREHSITFLPGFQPKGSKGPIGLTVTGIAFKWKKKTWYLESQGKTVNYDVAIQSMQELKWQ